MREEIKGCVALFVFTVAVAIGANTAKAGQKATFQEVQVSWDGQGEIELSPDDDGNFSLRLRLKGNVSVRGKRLDAKADRLMYDSEKNLLCLESDGNHDVRLSFQTPDDGQTLRIAARKIMVWLSTSRIMIDGAGTLSTSGHSPAEKPPASP